MQQQMLPFAPLVVTGFFWPAIASCLAAAALLLLGWLTCPSAVSAVFESATEFVDDDDGVMARLRAGDLDALLRDDMTVQTQSAATTMMAGGRVRCDAHSVTQYNTCTQ